MHRVEDFEWTNHCYEILKYYLPLNPPVYIKVIDLRLKKGFSESFVVQPKTSPVIISLYEHGILIGERNYRLITLNRI